MKSIYIHIPFCTKICSYCDFPKMLYNKTFVIGYLDALENEIKSRYKGEIVNTIYIGGGTPTALSVQELERLFQIIKLFKLNADIEFTIESNIESITEEKLKILLKNKINRISYGVESFNEKKLKYLNRNHNKEDIKKVIALTKKVGLNNINIDLIYGLKDETLEVLEDDINNAIKLDVNHISLYSLIIEDNTMLKINNENNIDEDLECDMYKLITAKLKENDFNHYEISNYAKNNYESKHNLVYWNNEEYYGFGLGAVSYLDNYRIMNTKNISKYNQNNYQEENTYENLETRMENEMILGLRKLNGVNITNFKNKYHKDIEEVFDIKKLLQEEKLIKENNHIKINEKFIYISNDILINFIGGTK